MANDIIIFWKGSAESYATLKLRGRIKPFGRYTVTSSDGTVREYLGTKLIGNSNLEQLACVDDVMSTSLFTEKWNKGELTNIRLLVGDNNAFEDDGHTLKTSYEPSESPQWFVAEFGDDAKTPIEAVKFECNTVRIKTLGLKEYQIIDNKLSTYDLDWINCGDYNNKEGE